MNFDFQYLSTRSGKCILLSFPEHSYLFNCFEGQQRYFQQTKTKHSKLVAIFLPTVEVTIPFIGTFLTLNEVITTTIDVIGSEKCKQVFEFKNNFTHKSMLKVNFMHENYADANLQVNIFTFGNCDNYVIKFMAIRGSFKVKKAEEDGIPAEFYKVLCEKKNVIIDDKEFKWIDYLEKEIEPGNVGIIFADENNKNELIDGIYKMIETKSKFFFCKSIEIANVVRNIFDGTIYVMGDENIIEFWDLYEVQKKYNKIYGAFHFANKNTNKSKSLEQFKENVSTKDLNMLKEESVKVKKNVEKEKVKKEQINKRKIGKTKELHFDINYNNFNNECKTNEKLASNKENNKIKFEKKDFKLIAEKNSKLNSCCEFKKLKKDFLFLDNQEIDSNVTINCNNNLTNLITLNTCYQIKFTQKEDDYMLIKNDLPIYDLECPVDSNEGVIFLGTGCAAPSVYRNNSGILIERKDVAILLDCGEDTLYNINRFYGNYDILSKLDFIFISHSHADHHLGLVSVLKKTLEYKQKVKVMAGTVVIEFVKLFIESGVDFYSNDDVNIKAKEQHWDQMTLQENSKIYNFSYKVSICPVQHYKDSVGIRLDFLDYSLSYSGDCAPSDFFAIMSKNVDLMIHEATFDVKLTQRAREMSHCTVDDAVLIFKKAKAKRLIMTHFSQRYPKCKHKLGFIRAFDFFKYEFDTFDEKKYVLVHELHGDDEKSD